MSHAAWRRYIVYRNSCTDRPASCICIFPLTYSTPCFIGTSGYREKSDGTLLGNFVSTLELYGVRKFVHARHVGRRQAPSQQATGVDPLLAAPGDDGGRGWPRAVYIDGRQSRVDHTRRPAMTARWSLGREAAARGPSTPAHNSSVE